MNPHHDVNAKNRKSHTVTGLGYQDDLPTWVFQSLGAASMCWDKSPGEPGAVFDASRARRIGDELLDRIQQEAPSVAREIYDPNTDPNQLALFPMEALNGPGVD